MSLENPSDENNSAQRTERPSDETNSKTPLAVNLESQITANHCDAPQDTSNERRERLKIRLEIGGLVVLLVYTIFTALMYCANKEAADAATRAATSAENSVTQARDNAHLDQRAWIYISGMVLHKLQIGEPAAVDLWIKNDGRTPGTPIGGAIQMKISYQPIDRLTDVPDMPKPKVGIIFPGIVYGPDTAKSVNGAVAADVVAFDAKPSRLWIYVFGRIDYRDVFDVTHTTSYCAVSNGTLVFGACPEGTYPTYAN